VNIFDVKDPKSDCASVATMLASLGLPRYLPAFEEEDINMDSVVCLDEARYIKMGIPISPRVRIHRSIALHGLS
jgi:hypothetical protein